MSSEISWSRVRTLQRKGITGKDLSSEEMKYLEKARKEDKEQYIKNHDRVKKDEMRKINPSL